MGSYRDDPAIRAIGNAKAAVEPSPQIVTLRSVLIGLAGVLVIGAFTYYNDFVVNNTFFGSSALPTVSILFGGILVAVNGFLSVKIPRWTIGRTEIAVILGMWLVACSIPSVGWFRYLPGHLVMHYRLAAEDQDFRKLTEQADLPSWLFPAVSGVTATERAADPVLRDFVGRANLEDPTYAKRFAAVPWRAWIKPAIAWGIFATFVMGTAMCLVILFRRQWVENERLPFPLATIYMALIEPPEPGKALNALLSNKLFWIGAGAVLVIHSLTSLATYDDRWPTIPIKFDLTAVLSEAPWSNMSASIKTGTIYFTVLAVIYFAETRVGLSIWLVFMIQQVIQMMLGGYGSTITGGMQKDQLLGAVVALGLAAIYLARGHLGMVIGQMFRGPRSGEPQGRYLPYRFVGWALAVCLAGMLAWMVAAGMTFVGAAVAIAILVLSYLVLARLVAETGLIYPSFSLYFTRPWDYLANLPGGGSVRTSVATYYFSGLFSGLLGHDYRESMTVYTSHALRIADRATGDHAESPNERIPGWKRLWPFIACLVLSAVTVYLVSGVATLYFEYSYASSFSNPAETPLNDWGTNTMPRWYSTGPTTNYLPPGTGPQENHSQIGHFAAGATIATGLTLGRLRFAGWPIHPVGFLLVNSWGIGHIWFSCFLGWLCKSTVVRFGGYSTYLSLRPLFLGFIFGEAGAAAFWLIVALVRVSLGMDYYRVTFLLS